MNKITLQRGIVRFISIMLTVCLVFSVMTLDAPEAYAADEPQAEATGQAPGSQQQLRKRPRLRRSHR